MIDSNNYTYVSEYIYEVLERTKPDLDADAVDTAVYYETHGEYEIAFEGLFIDIMKLEKAPFIDYEKGLEVARICELHKETVLDVDFWAKFERFAMLNIGKDK